MSSAKSITFDVDVLVELLMAAKNDRAEVRARVTRMRSAGDDCSRDEHALLLLDCAINQLHEALQ